MCKSEQKIPTQTRRIHFIADFEVYEPSHEPKVYTCQRCGEQVLGSRACYRHRKGILSNCRLKRLQSMIR